MNDARTRVGHTMRGDSVDVYAGRGRNGKHLKTAEIGERGWLGNPFRLEDYSRGESIAKFREEFEQRLERDQEFRAAIRDLQGCVLGCWCQSLEDDGPACHAEVIAEHADRLASEAPEES